MFPSILATEVREALLAYLRTTFGLTDARLEETLFDFLTGESGIFKGPYVDVRLPYRRAADDEPLPLDVEPDFTPYEHQLAAFTRLTSRGGHQPQNTLVTTGTGSGKTESFLYPILDHCHRLSAPGIKAILIYPMNALADDQAQRIAKILWENERLKDEVRAGIYVGGRGEHPRSGPEHLQDKRAEIRANPPDILLTNYRMLDLLLMRPRDRDLWRHNGAETLQYLVLDELHTYDGAQGSDVACMIRRLKARLGTPEGHLCCVGTSATIGGGTDESKRRLREFAGEVFGAEFWRDGVIGETRIGVDDVVVDDDVDVFPPVEEPGLFDPAEYADLEEFAAAQTRAWFGEDAATDPRSVAEQLEKSRALKCLLQAAADGPNEWCELRTRFARLEPEFAALDDSLQDRVLHSLVTLVSWSRRYSPHSDGEEPFLRVRVQSWVKELRRLIRRFGEEPEFEWEDRLDEDSQLWLPMVYCRECGESGYATKTLEGTERVEANPREIGRAFYDKSRYARFVRLGEETDGEFQRYLCPSCGRMDLSEECPGCDGRALAVSVWKGSDADKVTHFAGSCPACQADDALTMLGSRAASLSSVAISQMFTSSYNDHKKMLAFTDSVQDASHRAGFFGARTFRFNLRTAIQTAVRHRGGQLALDELGEAVLEVWEDELDDRRLVGSFWPPDLEWLEEYRSFADSDSADPSSKLIGYLHERLSWEVTMEYGLRSHVGRTLELTGCSTAAVESGRIDEASSTLHLQLVEEQLAYGAGNTSKGQVRHFLEGLVDRLRTRGGVVHPLLHGYIESEGARYLLSKKKNKLMSPFGPRSVRPRFLHSRRDADTFDSYLSDPRRLTWYRDWAARSMDLDARDSGIDDVYRAALRGLEEAGVLRCFDVGRGKRSDRVYGLVPSSLRVSSRVETLVCDECLRDVRVPSGRTQHREGSVCSRYRCRGTLHPGEGDDASWYARVYQSGKLQRIRAAEHTGLLEKKERRDLEDRFEKAVGPEAPNLIVCTPTLEMGIDIGDLSTLMLCSVPPDTSNYQQRVGRAGRESGTAYCLTVAQSRPHDLYFYEQPLAMAAGEVSVPGCFLDAVDMLKRQLVARCLDAWSRREEDVRQIPRNVRDLLTSAGRRTFPGRFVQWCESRDGSFVDDFLDQFGDDVADSTRHALRDYLVSGRLADAVEEAFDEMRDERDRLQRDHRKLEEERRDVEKADMTPGERKAAIEEIERAMNILGGLLGELNDKNPFNVLTDASILPNYAFPEPGVTLQATVRTRSDDERGHEYETEEYMRPAASALTELAPFNSFYASGRRFEITELDLGNRARPLTQTWRFCRACDYTERVHDETVSTSGSCPRCNDAHWSDVGQQRTVLRFRRVRTFVDAYDAVALDDSEDRRRRGYATKALLDAGPQTWTTAHVLEEMPFGFEFLHRVQLSELNFGVDNRWGSSIDIGGGKVPEEGFEVCQDCGRVRRVDGVNQGELQHAPYCRYVQNSNLSERTEQVYLARTITGEALRILVPTSDVGHSETAASFKAALELGLRRKFHGSPQHLRMLPTSEPVSEDSNHRRHFLVIYDTVPGGTGYLNDLAEKKEFLELLDEALTAMRSCSCDDGCYRCVYAYQHQWELDSISKRLAVEAFGNILEQSGDFVRETTLTKVDVSTRAESELERKFLDALHGELAAAGWAEVMWRGKLCYTFELGGDTWRIEPQVDIGSSDGVSVRTRPDFVVRCISRPNAHRAVAVYCDGFAYHVQPDRSEARLHDDVHKRRALIDSERYVVWSVTWDDVEAFLDGGESAVEQDGFVAEQLPSAIHELFNRADVTGLRPEVLRRNAVRQLLDYLEGGDFDLWRRSMRALLVGLIADEKPPLSEDTIDELENRLRSEHRQAESDELERAGSMPPVLGAYRQGRFVRSLCICPTDSLQTADPSDAPVRVLLRLYDSARARRDGFGPSWTAFLHSMNVLQFCERLEMHTTEGIERRGGLKEDSGLAEESKGLVEGSVSEVVLPEHYEVEAQDFPSLRPVLETAIAEDWPEPAFGQLAAGFPIDVVWKDPGVAVLVDEEKSRRDAAEAQGWDVYSAEEITEIRSALDVD